MGRSWTARYSAGRVIRYCALGAKKMLRLGAGFLLALFLISGCGFYFKTYRYQNDEPFWSGMNQNQVVSGWGQPLSVQMVGSQQLWRYLAPNPSQQGRQKSYYLVWFEDGKVVKWGMTEEEKTSLVDATQ